MRRVASFSIISFLILLILGACSNNTSNAKAEDDINTLNLEEEIFEKGNEILQMYYKAVRDDADISEEYDELITWFEDKYENADYKSEDEEYFVSQISLIKLNFEVYIMRKAYEEMSGEYEGESLISKEEIQVRLLETKEVFGVKFKN